MKKKKSTVPCIIIMIALVLAAIPVGSFRTFSNKRDEAYGYMYSIQSSMYGKTNAAYDIVENNVISGEERSAVKRAYTSLDDALYKDDLSLMKQYNDELNAAVKALKDSGDGKVTEFQNKILDYEDELYLDIQRYNSDADEFNKLLSSNFLGKISFVKSLEQY